MKLHRLLSLASCQLSKDQFILLPSTLQRAILTSSPQAALNRMNIVLSDSILGGNTFYHHVGSLIGISCSDKHALKRIACDDFFNAEISPYTAKKALLCERDYDEISGCLKARKLDWRSDDVLQHVYAVYESPNVSSLLSVDFSGTRIEHIPALNIYHCRDFRARNCGLRFLDEKFFDQFGHLTILDLGQNRLTTSSLCSVISKVPLTYLSCLELDSNFCLSEAAIPLEKAFFDALESVSTMKCDEFYLDLSETGISMISKGFKQFLMAVATRCALHLCLEGVREYQAKNGLTSLSICEISELCDIPRMSLDVSWSRFQSDAMGPVMAGSLDMVWNFNQIRALTLEHVGIGGSWNVCHRKSFARFLDEADTLEWLDVSNNSFSEQISSILADKLHNALSAVIVIIFDSAVDPNEIIEAIAGRRHKLGEHDRLEVVSIAHCERRFNRLELLGKLFLGQEIKHEIDECIIDGTTIMEHEHMISPTSLRYLDISGDYSASLITELAEPLRRLNETICTCEDTWVQDRKRLTCKLFTEMQDPTLALFNLGASESECQLQYINLSGCRGAIVAEDLFTVLKHLNVRWLTMEDCGLNDAKCELALEAFIGRNFDLIDLGGNKAGFESCKTAVFLLHNVQRAIINLESTNALKHEEELELAKLISEIRGKHESLLCCNIERENISPCELLVRHKSDVGRLERKLDVDNLSCILNDMGICVSCPGFCDMGMREFFCDNND